MELIKNEIVSKNKENPSNIDLKKELDEVEGEIDTLSKITFMGNLLQKQIEIRNTLDLRTNIVIGFNAALIVFLASTFNSETVDSIFMVPIFVILLLSLIIAIIALKPPHYHTKKGQSESLFYHHFIESHEMEDYRNLIHQTLKDEKNIYDAYITEIYNLTKYSNVPRKTYLNLSIRVIIYGIALLIVIYAAYALMAFLR